MQTGLPLLMMLFTRRTPAGERDTVDKMLH